MICSNSSSNKSSNKTHHDVTSPFNSRGIYQWDPLSVSLVHCSWKRHWDEHDIKSIEFRRQSGSSIHLCTQSALVHFEIHFRFDIIDIIASIPNKQKETQREDINEGQKGEEYWNIELPRSVYTDSTSRYLVDREHCNSCKHKSRLRRGSGVIGFVGSIKGRSWKVNRICMVYTKYCMEYGEWMTMRHL